MDSGSVRQFAPLEPQLDTALAGMGCKEKTPLYLRTGYLILLALCSASPFILGVAVAGVTSAVRQLLWLSRIPPVDAADPPPPTSI